MSVALDLGSLSGTVYIPDTSSLVDNPDALDVAQVSLAHNYRGPISKKADEL